MKQKSSGTFAVIALGVVILAVIVFSRSAAVEAVYPLERVTQFVKRSVWPRIAGVFSGPSNAAENVRLRREVATLSMLSGEIERLERENESLRRSLGYSSRKPERWIAAPVLTGHVGASGRGHVIRVGRGRLDGVFENAVVTTPDGLVGLVTGVTAHTSRVTLITDPSIRVACTIEIDKRRFASGILEGGDGGKLRLTHIRGLSADVPQARVVSSGRGGVFPKGFEVGRLSRSAAGESGEWSGEVVPGVDFDGLEDVFIRER